MERRGPSHLSPYGQACTSCFKSKCKCVARPDGPGCQRCHRLKKSCQPSDSARRQTIHKKDSDVRIAQLEKKLDGLISRLETRDPLDGDRAPASRTRTNRAGRTNQALDSEILGPSVDSFAAEELESQPELEPETDVDPALEDDADENLLGTFRSRMLPHFPFVHLPPDLTAHRLGAQRPLLLRAIVCVSSQKHKDSKSRELRCAMSAALLEEETGRLDLLLALLIYLSWGWDHSKLLPRLMLQAVSLACEIHAYSNSGSMDAPEIRALFQPGVTSTAASPPPPPGRGDFLECHRAVLGCFVLSRAVSTHLDHAIDALRWTPQMGEGLAALGASRVCPTDAAFAAHVRLQLLAHRAVHIRQQQQAEQAGHMQAPAGAASAAAAALVALAALQDLRTPPSSLPATTGAETARHTAHAWATELAIAEARYAVGAMVPFMVSHFSALTTTTTTTAGGGGRAGPPPPPRNGERAGCLWQCADAARACVDALLGLAARDFAAMALVQWTQLARGLAVLHHLTAADVAVEEPNWDRAAARNAVDFPELLDRVAEKLESAAAAVVAGGRRHEPEEVLTGIAHRMRAFGAVLRGGGPAPEHGPGQDGHDHSSLDGSARDLFHIPVSSYFA